MTMKFLLHKDKENGIPAHIQAHLAALTHGRLLRSQKSLHFSHHTMMLKTFIGLFLSTTI